MYLIRKFPVDPLAAVLTITLAAACLTPSARANVYATNIKINGGLNSITNTAGTPVSISFILNEPATLGTTVAVFSGTNVVHTTNILAGSPGTLMGTNLVVWNGLSDGGGAVPGGTYQVSITAAASGFTNWTQTSTDTNAGYHVYSPRGIAVNNNTNSLYYGRVFVGNATQNGTGPGDADGILKANADGSLADEGQSSGGYAWDTGLNNNLNPHFLRYGQDDRIYALNWDGLGEIVAFDMVMSTNQVVLNENNYSQNPFTPDLSEGWGTFDVTDAGTPNGRLWLGDADSPDGAGLWTWHMINGVADPNDMVGTQAVAVGGDLSTYANGGSMMDSHSNIYAGQNITDTGNPASRVMEFTNWNGTTPFTNGSAWQAGGDDDSFLGNFDLALDSRVNPKYVALCLNSTAGSSGGLRVLNATNGLVITNGTQVLANLDQANTYFGVAWDAAGNLYGAIGNLNGPGVTNKWRVFSPPGTNQSTTVAIETIQEPQSAPAPHITSITVNGTAVTIIFTAQAGDLPSAFTLQSAGIVSGGYGDVSSASISLVSPGVFQATTTTSGSTRFYRIRR